MVAICSKGRVNAETFGGCWRIKLDYNGYFDRESVASLIQEESPARGGWEASDRRD
jgi:hypothetical protein